ncbi:MAG: O-antigen ligase family protein [Haloechinothrix sp.]
MSPVHDRLQRYGPFALALFLLATSRWGSFLPAAVPPFITDIVIAVLLIDRVLGAGAHRERRSPIAAALAVSALGLLAISSAWFLLGQWSVVALRDAAPYAYVVLVFLVLAPAREHVRSIENLLTVALLFHATWCVVALVAPPIVEAIPTMGKDVFFFVPRPDIDGFTSGLLAGLALHRALSGKAPFVNLTLAGISLAITVALGSRGALLGVVAVLIAVGLLGRHRRAVRTRPRKWAVALGLLALPAAVTVAGQGYAVERLVASVSNVWAPTEDVGGAQGTASARADSWQRLIEYFQADTGRNVVGVGFGPNFLIDSNADVELFGGDMAEVRSPHNYLLGAWARLGVIGMAFVLALTLIGWRLAFLVGWRRGRELSDIDVLAIMIAAGMPLVAAVGVVLEAPFGAVPYFWALGHLSAVACSAGLATPIRQFLGGRRQQRQVRAT